MDHLAIMKKSWGLTDKVLTGEKTVESRWYKNKKPPWGKIGPGDFVYFKDIGGPVRVRAEVERVLQFANLTKEKAEEILQKYGEADLGAKEIMPEIRKYIEGKKFCILVFLKNPQKVQPFQIDKTGFGAMSAWITIDDINKIKKGGKDYLPPEVF